MSGRLNKSQLAVRSKLQASRPLISRLYREGLSVNQIAVRTGANYKTVSNYLVDWGLKARPKTGIDDQKEWVIKHYLDGSLSVEEMARKLKVKSPTVSNALRAWGVPAQRGFYRKKTRLLKMEKDTIINLYVKKKWTTVQIGKKYNLADCTVQLKLKEWGVPARSYVKLPPDEVLKMLRSGMTPGQIAKKCGALSGSVYKVLVDNFGIHHTKKVSFSRAEDDYIRELAGKGLSVGYLIEQFNKRFNRDITRIVMDRRLNELGVTTESVIRRKSERGNKPYSAEDIERFVRYIRSKRSFAVTNDDIAKDLGISISVVARLIKEYDIPRVNRVFTPGVKQELANRFVAGQHYSQIADEMGLKTESVRQELNRLGFFLGSSKWNKAYTWQAVEKQNELIRKWYRNPYYASITQMAKILGLDKTTVKARLKKMGIPIKSREQLKEARLRKLNKPKKIFLSRSLKKVVRARLQPDQVIQR